MTKTCSHCSFITFRVERLRPDQVSVIDRLVTRNTKVENAQGVSGTVRDWSVSCSAQIIGTNHVVEKVALDRLNPISVKEQYFKICNCFLSDNP